MAIKITRMRSPVVRIYAEDHDTGPETTLSIVETIGRDHLVDVTLSNVNGYRTLRLHKDEARALAEAILEMCPEPDPF